MKKYQHHPFFRAISAPRWRLLRIPIGFVLLLGGVLGFLPILGFWMVPFGLAILAIDFPLAARLLHRLERRWRWLRRYYWPGLRGWLARLPWVNRFIRP